MNTPPSTEGTGSLRFYEPLLDHVSHQGVHVGALLEKVGIPHTARDDPSARVRRSQITALWTAARAATRDRAIGLRAAMAAKKRTVGLASYLIDVSDSGADAVERASRCAGLCWTDADLHVESEPGRVVMRLRSAQPSRACVSDSEYRVGLFASLSQKLAVGVIVGRPVELRFAHEAPEHAVEYERILQTPVRFAAGSDSGVFDASSFFEPNPDADPVVRDVIEHRADELLFAMPRNETLAERVRAAVVSSLPEGVPGLEEVARKLRMSPRTLRRRLRQEGGSFQRTVDEARQDLALRELSEGARVEDVALRLGFSDSSGFHKAFRRWVGRSPAGFVGE